LLLLKVLSYLLVLVNILMILNNLNLEVSLEGFLDLEIFKG
jgi:hypothetical protein